MILTEAYRILQAAGCVSSQRTFSTAWLGRAPSYCSSMLTRAATRTMSTGPLLTLYHRVRTWNENSAEPDPKLHQLADTIWTAVMERIPQGAE